MRDGTFGRLTKALPRLTVKTSHEFELSEAGHTAKADCLVSTASATPAVVDEVQEPKEAPSNDDIYQIVAYGHRLQLPVAILVYPQVAEDRLVTSETWPFNIRLRIGDIRIYSRMAWA